MTTPTGAAAGDGVVDRFCVVDRGDDDELLTCTFADGQQRWLGNEGAIEAKSAACWLIRSATPSAEYQAGALLGFCVLPAIVARGHGEAWPSRSQRPPASGSSSIRGCGICKLMRMEKPRRVRDSCPVSRCSRGRGGESSAVRQSALRGEPGVGSMKVEVRGATR